MSADFSNIQYQNSLNDEMSNLVKVIIVDPVHNEDATVTTTVVLDPLPEPLKKFSRGMPVVVKYKQLGHWPGMIDTAKEGMVKKPWLTKVKKQVVFLFGFADHTWINEDKIFDYQGITHKKNKCLLKS